jgi:hypothetical protein
MTTRSACFAALVLAACAPAAPPPPAAPAPEVEFPWTRVWTAAAEVAILDSMSAFAVARPFTALEVLGADSARVRVRCPRCAEPVEGWVALDQVVYQPALPAVAAAGTLAEFALALRDAAERRDVQALLAVMDPEFNYAFIGPQRREIAAAGWQHEGFATLDLLPALLDRGLATRDGRLWAAPPEHFETLGYRGLRAGFRRTPQGLWEWVFLVRGERP